MDKKLKVLILEDIPSDAELAQRELKTVLKNHEIKVVDTEEGYSQALKTYRPDLIVSDYSLPTFNGMAALKIRNKEIPEIPFILLTGSINEETAVEIMKAGADDYVIKEHIRRLGSAVMSALEKKKIESERDQSHQSLIESEKLNKSITQTAADAIISINSGGIILSWNKAAERIFGYSSEEMMHKNLSDILPEQFKVEHNTALKRLKNMAKEKLIGITSELTALRKGKIEFPIELSISSWEANNQKYYTGIIRDITIRKKFIADLMEREEKYRTLTQNLNVGVYRRTPGKYGMFIEVNPAFVKIFGFRSKKELERWKVIDFYKDPLDHKRVEEKLVLKGFIINEELELRKKDGTIFSASSSATVAKDESGKILHYDGIIEDITEQRETREKLILHKKNLEALSNELAMSEEKVKRGLAIALHDTIGQLLIALKYKISELNRKVEKSEHKKLISETSDILKDAINETRNITYELSPPVLYEMGLVPAISWKLDEIEKNNKIKTSLTDQSKSYELDEKEQIIIYRSINELLQNVLKHSKAESVNVSFKLLPNEFRITINDNGIGFNLEAIRDKAVIQKKFGLFSIMERIRYIGGDLNINAVLNIGTKVVINLPIKNK